MMVMGVCFSPPMLKCCTHLCVYLAPPPHFTGKFLHMVEKECIKSPPITNSWAAELT